MTVQERPFAQMAKDLRSKLRLTQVQAAEKIGTSFNTWNCWERGRRDPQKIFQRLLIDMAREANLNLKKYGDLDFLVERKNEADIDSGESRRRGR